MNATSTMQNSSTTVDTTTNPGGPMIPASSPKPVTPAASQPAPAPVETIHFISPVPNDTWVIGQSNSITWNEAPGVTGYLSLINPTTGAQVGVILNQVSGQQTSYSWNSVSVLLSRTNPSKEDVVPGTYEIRFTFDGNGLTPITTSPFTIAPAPATQY